MAARLLVIAIYGFAAIGLACGSEGDTQSESEVLAAYSCPEERCISADVALETLGHNFLEPASLPRGFGLYSRVLSEEPPQPGAQSNRPAYSVFEEFRFQGSSNVPGILLIQSWPFPDRQVRIQTQDESCGTLEPTALGPVYYAAGLVRILPVPEQNLWLVCLDESAGHEHTHFVVAAANGGLIEIIAFPESGVSKEEVVSLVSSLLPVSVSAD